MSNRISTEWINVCLSFLPLLVTFLLIAGTLTNVAYIYYAIAVFLGLLVTNWLYTFYSKEGFNEGSNAIPLTKLQIAIYEFFLAAQVILFLPTIFLVTYGLSKNTFSTIDYIAIVYLLSVYVVTLHDAGHEYLHAKELYKRILAHIIGGYTFFTGFYIEHTKLHHVTTYFLGTEDIRWGRYNQSIYNFVWESYINAAPIIWNCEKRRLREEKKNPYSWRNKGYWPFVLPAILVATLLASFNFFAVCITLLGISIGSMRFNARGYSNHYALKREIDPKTGELEAINDKLAWDRNDPLTKYYFYGAMRHQYHHMWPGKHYYEYIKLPTGPYVSPLGYEIAFYLILIPSIYTKMMNSYIEKNYPHISINKEYEYTHDTTEINF